MGDLVKVTTRIGTFVTRAWVTEGLRPGVVAMSHHLGRWRLHEDMGQRSASALVTIDRQGNGRYAMRQVHGVKPFESDALGDPLQRVDAKTAQTIAHEKAPGGQYDKCVGDLTTDTSNAWRIGTKLRSAQDERLW